MSKFEQENSYKTIGEIYCPYFQEKIIFNAKGLEHLKFIRKNHARSQKDQYIRFKLLHLAPEVLNISRTLQGISKRNVRVRVIVKQVGESQKYFWSIIPYWKVDKNTKKRKMSNGNSEED